MGPKRSRQIAGAANQKCKKSKSVINEQEADQQEQCDAPPPAAPDAQQLNKPADVIHIGATRRTAQGIASSATLQNWVRDLHQKLFVKSKKPRIARFVDHVEYAIEQSSRLALHVDTAGSIVIYLDTLPVHNEITSQIPSIDNKTTLEMVMGAFVGMVPCRGVARPDLVITYKWGEWEHHGVPCQVRLPGADDSVLPAWMKPSLQPGISQCPPVIASPECCHLLPAGSDSAQCCGNCQDLQKKLHVHAAAEDRKPG